MDVHSKKTRSFNMSRVRSKDTGPEKRVRSCLYKNGFRFRLHRKDLPGKPDLVLRKLNTVIFVNGCFWHSHTCKFGVVKPSQNAEFWKSKRENTVTRDQRQQRALEEMGWRVKVIWECETRAAKADQIILDRVQLDQ